MNILSEENQQQVLTTYQKDYGMLILAYNKLGNRKPKEAINKLHIKAICLLKEITNDIQSYKNFFSEENKAFAREIANTVRKFIDNCLVNYDSNNSIGFPGTSPSIAITTRAA